MKNDEQYLRSVMKKYDEAKAKRRRRVYITSSAVICATILFSAPFLPGIFNSITNSDFNNDIGNMYEDGASYSNTPSSPLFDAVASMTVGEETDYVSQNIENIEEQETQQPGEEPNINSAENSSDEDSSDEPSEESQNRI